eukprot:5120628-Pyramimonas_sp.AAC.1
MLIRGIASALGFPLLGRLGFLVAFWPAIFPPVTRDGFGPSLALRAPPGFKGAAPSQSNQDSMQLS